MHLGTPVNTLGNNSCIKNPPKIPSNVRNWTFHSRLPNVRKRPQKRQHHTRSASDSTVCTDALHNRQTTATQLETSSSVLCRRKCSTPHFPLLRSPEQAKILAILSKWPIQEKTPSMKMVMQSTQSSTREACTVCVRTSTEGETAGAHAVSLSLRTAKHPLSLSARTVNLCTLIRKKKHKSVSTPR